MQYDGLDQTGKVLVTPLLSSQGRVMVGNCDEIGGPYLQAMSETLTDGVETAPISISQLLKTFTGSIKTAPIAISQPLKTFTDGITSNDVQNNRNLIFKIIQSLTTFDNAITKTISVVRVEFLNIVLRTPKYPSGITEQGKVGLLNAITETGRIITALTEEGRAFFNFIINYTPGDFYILVTKTFGSKVNTSISQRQTTLSAAPYINSIEVVQQDNRNLIFKIIQSLTFIEACARILKTYFTETPSAVQIYIISLSRGFFEIAKCLETSYKKYAQTFLEYLRAADNAISQLLKTFTNGIVTNDVQDNRNLIFKIIQGIPILQSMPKVTCLHTLILDHLKAGQVFRTTFS